MQNEMDALVQMVAEVATQILVSGEELIPMAFSVQDNPDEGLKLVTVPVPPFENDEHKAPAFALALSLAKAYGSNRLLTITDAWMALVEPGEVDELGQYPKPSQRLDRKEALVLTDCTELGVTTHILEYSRDESGVPVPKEWVTMEEPSEGMMVNLISLINRMPPPTDEERKVLTQLAEMAGTVVSVA